MPDDLAKKLAAKGGVIGFHIGNEFHNVKMFNWRTEHAGKPFWDTSAIGKSEAQRASKRSTGSPDTAILKWA